MPRRRRVSFTGATRGRTVPTGMVFFLFSDIEGSTIRWETKPQAMEAALRRHDAILHDAVGRNMGYVFKTVGDEFCTAFQHAHNAVAAAIAIQRELAAEDFNSVEGLRVRVAIHGGKTDERSGDYFGPPVNRVARLLSTAHGGQVLLSAIVAESLDGYIPAEAKLVDLGWHRLKDMEEPEHVFQLAAPGLDEEFAPIRSLNTGANNLPRQTTSFVGRENDVAEVVRLLNVSPLVSIVGVGGVGKTRLALQVAAEVLHEYRDGVWFVNLAPIDDPNLVASTILSTLAVTHGSGKSAMETLLSHLKTRSLLLFLDNCEHLIGEAAIVTAEILTNAPLVRILTTTREALNVPGEHVYRVPTLGIEDAVQLFIDRARAAKADFVVSEDSLPVVEEICNRVDGLALAIELAAARMRVLSLRDLASHLKERFRVLTGGSRTALPRQKTLHALIDWSHNLLLEEEKILFRRLAVFSGSFSLEAAADVCVNDDLDEYEPLDVLTALVEKSLVVAESSNGQTRYRLLQSIEDYASGRLNEAGESEPTSRCHATYFAEFAERAYLEWDTGPAPDWLARSSVELDNIRAALSWTISENREAQIGTRIISSGFPIFLRLSLLSEAIGWAECALISCEPMPVEAAARLEFGLSMLYNNALDEPRALSAAERAVSLYSSTDNIRGTIGAMAQLAQIYARYERFHEARELGDEALSRARKLNDPRLLAVTLQRSAITFRSEEIETARGYFNEAVTLFQGAGCDEDTGRALVWWAAAEADASELQRATEILHRAVPLVAGDIKLFVLLNLAEYTLTLGQLLDATTYAMAALNAAHSHNHMGAFSIAAAFVAAATVDVDVPRAARLLAFARRNFTGSEWPPRQYGGHVFDRLETRLRERLSATEHNACETAGAAWSITDVVKETADLAR